MHALHGTCVEVTGQISGVWISSSTVWVLGLRSRFAGSAPGAFTSENSESGVQESDQHTVSVQ